MSEIYSIIKRHDERKGADVWAVRIKPIAYSVDFLAKLKDLAKVLRGSYKVFEGAKRFVFITEGEANDFCCAIMECIGNTNEPKKNVETHISTSTNDDDNLYLPKENEIMNGSKIFTSITTIEFLKLHNYITARTYSYLKNNNYEFVGDIIADFTSPNKPYSIRGLGEKTHDEIKFIISNTKLYSREQINGDFNILYFSEQYKFLNYNEIKLVVEYFKQHNVEPFLFILYKYITRSNKKEHIIYCYHHGLYNGKIEKLENVAEIVNLSRERVRQILKKQEQDGIEEVEQIKYCSDAIANSLIIDEYSDIFIKTVQAQHLPKEFNIFSGILPLLGCFSCHTINGHKFVLNYKRAFDFDCIDFIQRCHKLNGHRRDSLVIPISDMFNTKEIEDTLTVAKHIASNYLGLEVTDNDEIVFKQKYIDYENEIYNIIIKNGEPMLLNDIMAILYDKHPDFKINKKERIRDYMYSRNRITSIPSGDGMSKLYCADASKCNIDLDSYDMY